jgi:hypothetical protein
MKLNREQAFELAGGLSGAAVAYGGVAFGAAAGWFRLGILLLVVTVPLGVLVRWMVAQMGKLAARLLDD